MRPPDKAADADPAQEAACQCWAATRSRPLTKQDVHEKSAEFSVRGRASPLPGPLPGIEAH